MLLLDTSYYNFNATDGWGTRTCWDNLTTATCFFPCPPAYRSHSRRDSVPINIADSSYLDRRVFSDSFSMLLLDTSYYNFNAIDGWGTSNMLRQFWQQQPAFSHALLLTDPTAEGTPSPSILPTPAITIGEYYVIPSLCYYWKPHTEVLMPSTVGERVTCWDNFGNSNLRVPLPSCLQIPPR